MNSVTLTKSNSVSIQLEIQIILKTLKAVD